MSFDLYERETAERMSRMVPVKLPEVGVWDGFVRGTAMTTMRGFAKAASAIDLAGAVGPIIQDAITGGTEAKDRYFREHDEVWGRAVDFWTPRPMEVGAAAEVAGMLLSTLPLVIANPSLAVGTTQLSVAEELVKKGVEPTRAQAVAAAQAAGLGLGIYMPIFGQTLTQRILAGGIGFNLVQGIAMRGAGEYLLKGTPAEGEYRAFDPTGLTLDVLLGAAFGGLVHLSPTQRAHGAAMWQRMENWAKGLKPSDIDALTALRQAQHLNADSLPGRPAEPVDLDHHVQRVRTAMEQLVRDEPVNVSDLPTPRFEPDPGRIQEMAARARELAGVAEEVRVAEGLPRAPAVEIPDNAGRLSPEQRAVERRAKAQVQADLEGQVAAYKRLRDSEGGKVINTDIARELFPDYKGAREIHSPSVHEPASAVVKEVYARALQEPDPNGLNMVTFTAGGTGAGKSSALGAVELSSHIVQASQVVYDTNLSNARSAISKINAAIAAGKQVNIMYVGADPEVAFRRALTRAMKIGRTVPLPDHIATHKGSADAMLALQEHYRGNDKVQFVFLDNSSRGKGEVSIIAPERAPAYLRSINFDNLEARLKEVLDAEYKAGRISEKVYRGTAESAPGAEGGAPRAAGEGEPRGGGEGRAAREEVDAATPPKAGEPILVFRLGNEGGLENRNAGNAGAIGRFLQRLDDVEAPQPAGQRGGGAQIITAYEVTAPKGFGKYTAFDQGQPKGQTDLPGRRAVGKAETDIEYSFPKEAEVQARPLASVTLEEVRATLERISGLKSFDDAGGALSARALRETIAARLPESEAPAAPRGGAESPPPRGSRPGEAAGVEDPMRVAAVRMATEQPDMVLKVGTDADGNPVTRTARQFLEEAEAQADRSLEQTKLFEVAADCLLAA